jgi:dTDP-4-amino-4,6-dideoxygalactose transaminase
MMRKAPITGVTGQLSKAMLGSFPYTAAYLPAHRENLPVVTMAAQQGLCLPIYPDLDMSVIEEIAYFVAAQ